MQPLLLNSNFIIFFFDFLIFFIYIFITLIEFNSTYSLGDIQYELEEAANVRAKLVKMYESVDIIR